MKTLTLDPLLMDWGVLQRGVRLPIGGWARPGAGVAVSLAGQTGRGVADATGRFCVWLGPLGAGGPWTLTVAADGGEAVECNHMMIGELWVCSGQSNMEMALEKCEDGEAEARRAGDAGLRLLRVGRRVLEEPAKGLMGEKWEVCGPESARGFSGMAYYFGLALRKAGGVPVGLVQAAVGATPAESWVRPGVLAGDADYAPVLERFAASRAAYPDEAGVYRKLFEKWDLETDLAEREGRALPGAQPKLMGPGHPWTPSGLWNGMVAPLTGQPIGGVIWAQGAAHPERAYVYRKLFRALIRDWRAAWGRSFPFLFVQEAAFGPRRDEPGEHSWAELREAQAMGLAEPATAMAVSLDTGQADDIHPVRKKPVGERLARAARAVAWGEKVAYSGPVWESMQTEGRRVRLRFSHAEGGLKSSDGKVLEGFSLSAGAGDGTRGNRGFHWAKAWAEGDCVVLESDAVALPVAARYAWAQNPRANLVNGAGLPASPFRTDDWPGVTVGVR